MFVFLLRSTILLLNSLVSAKCFCRLPQAFPTPFLILFLFSKASLLQSRAGHSWNITQGEALCRVGMAAGEPRQAGCPWRRPDMCSRVFRLVPSCGTGGHPPAIAVGCVLNQNQGVPRGLAVTLPARAHGEVLHGRGNQEGPFSPWLK